ncbi:MAG TPA: nuclear transport factor 2 family protein [Silvibacterium sp.]|nr:nuclear transport factor 2 family protein [Silvibacterium sp.]
MKFFFVSLTASAVLFGSLAVAGQTPQQTAPQQPPEIIQFQKLEDQWSDAVAKHDQYSLELLMSPLLVSISSTGEVTTRNQQIALLFEKSGPQLVSMEQRVINVHNFEDMAVVDGTYIIKWKIDGQIREERGIFTHVYQRTRGNWVCAHAQRTAVVEKSDQKQKAAASKKSNAELPFHIPLVYHGKQSTQPPPAAGSQNDPPQ